MTGASAATARPQHPATFLADWFGLTPAQAREILDRAGGDRDSAAERARQPRDRQP